MSYLERVQSAMAYIEEHLNSELDLEEVARRACFSLYHFHRVFRQVTHSSLGEFIRRRRLTEAARELRMTERRVLDIAVDYGYGSQAAFTRAFKAALGEAVHVMNR